ncbi:hypothetical protein OG849_08835 [Streptomyces cyaneofuscatus]|uniref:Uncharacterized protein n=1 Tax=Streptomyces cyaneofuscatus TaxID=66883 RepID=A0ABZ1ETH5_9ACTN|nr:hypothetical protein OG849_08835 [Streptomyces cyaneofuscatus]
MRGDQLGPRPRRTRGVLRQLPQPFRRLQRLHLRLLMGRPVVRVLLRGQEIALLQVPGDRPAVAGGQRLRRGPLHLRAADRDEHLHPPAVLRRALLLVLLRRPVPLPGDLGPERQEIGAVPRRPLQDPLDLRVEVGTARAPQRLDLLPVRDIGAVPLVLGVLPRLGLAALQELPDRLGVRTLQRLPGRLPDLFLVIELREALDQLTVLVRAEPIERGACGRCRGSRGRRQLRQGREQPGPGGRAVRVTTLVGGGLSRQAAEERHGQRRGHRLPYGTGQPGPGRASSGPWPESAYHGINLSMKGRKDPCPR